MADLLAGKTSKSKDDKDREKALKQIKSAVSRIQSGESQQSAQQLGYSSSGSQTFEEQSKARKKNPFASALSTTLNVLARPGQATMRGLQQFSGSGTGALSRIDDAAKASLGGLTDLQGTNDIDSFEMVNKTNPGGAAAVTADLATQIVLDPLTFAGGLGLGGKGKQGLEIISKSVGKDVAEQVQKKGYQSLSKPQQSAVRAAIVGSEDAARAGGDNALVSAYRNATGRSARSGTAKFTESLIGKEGAAAQVGKLVDAQGLSVLGKTVAPGVTFGSIGKVTGISKAANTVKETQLASTLVKAFKPRAGIATSLGSNVADVVGQAQKASRAAEYRLNDADVNALKNAIGKSNFDDRTLRIMDNALDTGRVDAALKTFTKQGNKSAVKTLRTLDSIRKRTTERYVASGLAEASQLRDSNKYLHRSLTPEAEKWIERNKDQAARLLGFAPSPESAGLLKNAGPQFRRLDPNAAASDLNKKLAKETGIYEFFSTNAIERVLTRSTQINHGYAVASLLDDLTRATDEIGNPLAIAGRDSSKPIKAIERETSDLVKNLTKELTQLRRFEQRRAIQVATLRQSVRSQEATLNAAKASRARIEQKIQSGLTDVVNALSKRNQFGVLGGAVGRTRKEGELRTRARLANKSLNELEKQLATAVKAEERARERLQKIAEKIPESPARTSTDVSDEIKAATQTMRAQTKQLRDLDKAHMSEIKKLGYREVDAGPLGKFFAPAEIVEEVAKTTRMLQDDDALKAFGSVVGGATQAWKNLALNTIVLGTGTSARNAVGNLMLMWTAGYKDVATFTPAVRAVRSMRRLEKSGRSLDEVAKDKRLNNWERWAMKNAVRLGVVGAGFNRTDLAKTAVAATRKDRLVQAIDVRKPEALLTRHMSQVNQEIEDTSRLAFYFDALKKTGNPRVAAKMTDDALINYQDLTNVERKIKLLVPFYTFMSRNLAIQAYALANTPGRVNNIQKVRDAIFTNDTDTDGAVIPDYVLEAGQKPFLTIAGVPLTGTFQSPLDAAGSTVQPLADLASRAPGVDAKYQTEAGVKGGIAGLAQNIGGAPGSFAKQLGGEMAGVDPFTGAPLKEGESSKRLLGSLVPIIGRTENLNRDLTGDSDARRSARILSTLGVSATAIDDQRQSSEIYRRLRELGASAKRQDISTVTELKKQGKYKGGKKPNASLEALKKKKS